MRFICLAYMDESIWNKMSATDLEAFTQEADAYDEALRRNGHIIGGEALQSARNAATLRYRDGKVSVADGPYSETKEQLGGLIVLEARDLNEAIQLMSSHPGLRHGITIEVRPADMETYERYRERMEARAAG